MNDWNPSLNVRYYGSPKALPDVRLLQAGALTARYENGDLRYICFGKHEIIRRIYGAVRDHNWGTIPARLENVSIEAGEDSFTVQYDAIHQQNNIDFRWHATITGAANGTITFRFEGEAHSSFRRNRIGLCILHPGDEFAGRPCTIEHTDGSTERGQFPEFIAPHQPFFDLRAVTTEIMPGLSAETRFDGDTFEMEDQRNWTDASFKTYSTPLALPFPAEVAQGTKIVQTVTVRLHGNTQPEPRDATNDKSLYLILDESKAIPLPAIGLSIPADIEPLNPREVELLQALNPAHLRLDLALAKANWSARLKDGIAYAGQVGAPLEIALYLDGEQEDGGLNALQDTLRENTPEIVRWIVFVPGQSVTEARWVQRAALQSVTPGSKFGGGTDAYFTDLNRNRPTLDGLDFVNYSANPQVHAFDVTSLAETPDGYAATLKSAAQFTGDVPISISPITLRPRFNPAATAPDEPHAPGELPSSVDLRQLSLFAAGWLVGVINGCAGAETLHSLTFFETIGWHGVIERATGSPLPEKFPSAPGMAYPVYHVLADVGAFRGGQILPITCGDPLRVRAVALRQGERSLLLIANLTGASQTVALPHAENGTYRLLKGDSFGAAALDPLHFREQSQALTSAEVTLPPFGIMRVDLRSRA